MLVIAATACFSEPLVDVIHFVLLYARVGRQVVFIEKKYFFYEKLHYILFLRYKLLEFDICVCVRAYLDSWELLLLNMFPHIQFSLYTFFQCFSILLTFKNFQNTPKMHWTQ